MSTHTHLRYVGIFTMVHEAFTYSLNDAKKYKVGEDLPELPSNIHCHGFFVAHGIHSEP